jgi:hypothetical protein
MPREYRWEFVSYVRFGFWESVFTFGLLKSCHVYLVHKTSDFRATF